MEIIIGICALFILMILIYALIAVFFPEWVGITGNKSKDVNKSHKEENSDNKKD